MIDDVDEPELDAETIVRALGQTLPRLQEEIGSTVVVKVGGSVGDEGTLLEDIAMLSNLGLNLVVVHGGGPQISRLLERLGVQTRFVQGRRVTDDATLDVAHMVLSRLNGQLVAYLDALGAPAIGLTGLDGGLLRARLRDPELGLVGDVEDVDEEVIETILENGYIPVIAPLAIGPDGEILNVNADSVAGDVARALQAEHLMLCTDVPGVMDADGNVLYDLSREEVEGLIEDGTVGGGMIPKVEACLRAVEGAERAHIVDGREPNVLLKALLLEEGAGTTIWAEGDDEDEDDEGMDSEA